MAIIPENTHTTEYQIESKRIYQKPRSYLGMSGLGASCLRAQWYGWRWINVGSVIARVNRIFTRGHLEESSIIMDLREVGVEIFRRKGEDKIQMTGAVGEEQEEIIGFAGHAKGHPDGRALGIIEAPKTEHLLEFKTMKDSKYMQLKEATTERDYGAGLKQIFPVYHSQVQRYSGALKLKRIFFVATNKDNQARQYIRIKHDKKEYQSLREKEENIILSELPPKKAHTADHYLCGWCSHYQVCHLGAEPQKNCRTCEYGDLMPEGKWKCGNSSSKYNWLSTIRQRKGCKKHKRLF